MIKNSKTQKEKQKQKRQKKISSLIQVMILVIAIFAFSWMIGSSIEVVSANGECTTDANCEEGEVCNLDTGYCELPEEPESNAGFCGDENINFETGEQCDNGLKDNGNICDNSVLSCVYCSSKCQSVLLEKNPNSESGLDAANIMGTAGTGINLITGAIQIKDQFFKDDPETVNMNMETGEDSSNAEQLAKEKADEIKGWQKIGSGEGIASSVGSFFGGVAAAVGAAIAAKFLVSWALKKIGVSDGNYDVLNTASWVGAGVGAAVGIIAGLAGGLSATGVGAIAAAVVVVVTAIVAGFTYQDYSGETFTYTVGVWQPPEGGKDCERCNELYYGCSEYQCRSFGQACLLANEGTEDEQCVWNNSNDRLAPVITLQENLMGEEYIYRPIQVISPPDHGARVIYNPSQKGCIPSYSNLTIGFQTDEPAYCKVDLERKSNFTELGFDLNQGNSFVYNHSLFLPSSAFPSASALNNLGLTIDGDKDYYFYFMCKDFNGNSNTGNFVMEFCTDMGPDERAPLIKGTNYLDETYVQYDQTEAYLEVYTDEPADCKWDFLDLEYENMNYDMGWCSPNTNEFLEPSSLTYGCRGNLEGLENNENNIYYIKCKDQPWLEQTEPHKRNANKQSHILNLIGTYPLVIDEITINGKENNTLIKDATDVIEVELKVTTSGGAGGEGLARCQYGVEDSYYYFYNEGNFEYLYLNMQNLFLTEGEHNYPIRCIGQGGNIVESGISFTVEKDVYSPEAVRVYYEEENLKLVTNEAGECVYSLFTGCGFNFEDGNSMQESEDGLNHFIEWSTDADVFIKCQDKYENRPAPANGEHQCTVVVRGSDYYS